MKITKYEHACLILEKDKQRLVIDPGKFTNLPSDLTRVVGVIVTEEHFDHFYIENIEKIIAVNPDVTIYSTSNVCEQLNDKNIKCKAISGNKTVKIDGFTVEFREGDHAPSYRVSPCRVLTIKIDGQLYYPGDSYIKPLEKVQILALPTCGPWHKVEEAVDFANSVDSDIILATHNGLYNDHGQHVANHFISANISDEDREWIYLEVGATKEF